VEGKEVLIDQVVHNWQRVDLKPLETANALARLRDEFGMSQQELAVATGKPASEISRLLSLERLSPETKREAEESGPGTLTRRHLIAIAQLEPERQAEIVARIRVGGLSAVETERAVSKIRRPRTVGKTSKGPGAVRRYAVGSATLQITFRKSSASAEDVLNVLDRVRAMVSNEGSATAPTEAE
jgi:ParB family transcriptional regulator, chromosome partitioning protein